MTEYFVDLMLYILIEKVRHIEEDSVADKSCIQIDDTLIAIQGTLLMTRRSNLDAQIRHLNFGINAFSFLRQIRSGGGGETTEHFIHRGEFFYSFYCMTE